MRLIEILASTVALAMSGNISGIFLGTLDQMGRESSQRE